ncbi:hypothetical protein [Micromonospora sp. L31]|uniref:hypothetical protein n=1 Tax=Micromonospora sp. L31 TaxID=3452213 RepID=UPI003F8CB8C4
MRTHMCAGLLAAVLALAGCTATERTTATTSASPSSGVAAPHYALTAQACSAIDFEGLKPVVQLSPAEDPVSSNWLVPANFLYTGGVQCTRSYGPAKRPVVVVSVGMATYQSPEGSRLAYDTRLVKETTEGALPGVELMSHRHDDTSDALYLRDGNLFVEVMVTPLGNRTFAQAGLGPDVASAVEAFAARLVDRLRTDFTG